MLSYKSIQSKLFKDSSNVWLVTGVAGFIGSNILEKLLTLNQQVIGLDNFSNGSKENILLAINNAAEKNNLSISTIKKNFNFIEGDISDIKICKKILRKTDYVLHQAAIGSVPRSIKNPIIYNKSNVEGFLNILYESMKANVKSFVYASSSSVYGDSSCDIKKESIIGAPLSPYALTKRINELYADIFQKNYKFTSIGLRYFNVFGIRQDPFGPYAAVIPKWINALMNNEDVYINGDGTTTRDFCYVDNCVQMNILSAIYPRPKQNLIFNVAANQSTSLLSLYELIRTKLEQKIKLDSKPPIFRDFRKGDIKHSLADISYAQKILGYVPEYSVDEGLELLIDKLVNR